MVPVRALGTLLVLDFDWTVIETNADTIFLDLLPSENHMAAAKERLREAAREQAWTAGVDHELGLLHSGGVSLQHLRDFMTKIPIDPKLADAIRSYADAPGGEAGSALFQALNLPLALPKKSILEV
ncbi:hypothetical protein T484DRAFT_1792577 [Baffinella frigidus]|nr:hypothetical protein T484DRAFT_1792577 [Cryptophyta sp. CCMP2293]